MKIVVLFLCAYLSVLLAQTHTLRGKVLDMKTGAPLERATVLIPASGTGTVTSSDGSFRMEVNLRFPYRIVCSHVGYSQAEREMSEAPGEEFIFFLTPRIISAQSIIISASLPSDDNRYITYDKISRDEIQQRHTLQDLPQFLQATPSVFSYSEGGSGVGYNYLSIRGFDQRRIAVHVNGIPQNDPEDHNVYWIDFYDILGSSDFVQVQRGTGGGMFGYPAIGGAINIVTNSAVQKPGVHAGVSYGDYQTRKYHMKYTSGLIENKYIFTTKLSQTLTSGYRDMAWAKLSAFYFSVARLDERLTTQFNFYGGPLEDGLVYTGLPKAFISDKENRKKNFSYWEYNNGALTYSVPRRDIEKENFSQPHFDFLQEYKLSDALTINSAVFLILGDGFFDYDASWAGPGYFRLPATANITNAMIHAQVENRQYGWLPKLRYESGWGELNAGLEFRKHSSLHWGSLLYATGIPFDYGNYHRFYSYEGGKDIISGYVNQALRLSPELSIMGELHLTTNTYRLKNEAFVGTDFSVRNTFLNYRFGINYLPVPDLHTYLVFGAVSREPRLKNYYDAAESSGGAVPNFEQNPDATYNFSKPYPKPETMRSLEFGTVYEKENLQANVNFYYMNFKDEIVKNGKLDKFGSPVTGNADRTLHIGMELGLKVRLLDIFKVTGNYTLSRNRFLRGREFQSGVSRIGPWSKDIVLDGNRIAGFPDKLYSIELEANYKNINARTALRYVGDFYSDNYDNQLTAVAADPDGYYVGYRDNLNESYTEVNFFVSAAFNGIFSDINARVFLQIDNLLNSLHSQYAIGKEFFPNAERSIVSGVTFEF